MNIITKVKEKAKVERESFLEKAYQLMAEGVIIIDPNRISILSLLENE